MSASTSDSGVFLSAVESHTGSYYSCSGSAGLPPRRSGRFSYSSSDAPPSVAQQQFEVAAGVGFADADEPAALSTWTWTDSDDLYDDEEPTRDEFSRAERGRPYNAQDVAQAIAQIRDDGGRARRRRERVTIWRGRACKVVLLAFLAGSVYLTYWSAKQVLDGLESNCERIQDCDGGGGTPSIGYLFNAIPRMVSDPTTAFGLGVTGSEALMLLWMHCGQPPITCGRPPTFCEWFTGLICPNGDPL